MDGRCPPAGGAWFPAVDSQRRAAWCAVNYSTSYVVCRALRLAWRAATPLREIRVSFERANMVVEGGEGGLARSGGSSRLELQLLGLQRPPRRLVRLHAPPLTSS